MSAMICIGEGLETFMFLTTFLMVFLPSMWAAYEGVKTLVKWFRMRLSA
ncbi:MAG: hypothetical protein JSV27_04320 [Candidatus Bathyarchaeota archaeon]|nr:MAG: hypothetical protein JSV27_04320 [Candidatus Bathyarchaeota archaeon]